MTVIDVGAGATDRAFNFYNGGASITLIDKTNPANADGFLTSMELWNIYGVSNCKCGTFSGSGTSWDDRDYDTLGTVAGGDKQTFSGVVCSVSTNDILGVYCTYVGNNTWELDNTGGSGVLQATGDKFGSGSNTYTEAYASGKISIYALGATSVKSGPHIAKILMMSS